MPPLIVNVERVITISSPTHVLIRYATIVSKYLLSYDQSMLGLRHYLPWGVEKKRLIGPSSRGRKLENSAKLANTVFLLGPEHLIGIWGQSPSSIGLYSVIMLIIGARGSD